jgi:TrmH family RNA methyltransferase
LEHVLVLEGVQDPGNVGTILRTADAFSINCVVLLEGCADVYAPKTVRSTMGAVFRQFICELPLEELPAFCRNRGLKLYGAALSDRAKDVRTLPLRNAAVCVGSEGRGLSRELLGLCDGEVIIPMRGPAESLNAAVAAAVLMWEMTRE